MTQAAIDQLRLQVASLRSATADLKADQAQAALAEQDFARVAGSRGSDAVSQQQYDQDLDDLKAARDKVAAQMEAVQQKPAAR